jgi:hypothetical protein
VALLDRERSAAPPGGVKFFRGRFALLAQIVSLAATGCLLWFAAQFALIFRLSLGALIVQALGYALLAWLWSGAIIAGLYLMILGPERARLAQSALRTSTAAVWFAPATILLAHFSPGALIAALVLVVNATRLLYSGWLRGGPEPEAPGFEPQAGELFDASLTRAPVLPRNLGPAVAVSLATQAGVCAILLRYPLTAAGLLVMSAAMLTVLALSVGAWQPWRPPTLSRAIIGVAATILLAAGLTIGGLAVRVLSSPGGSGAGSGGGPLDTARALLRELLYKNHPAAQPAKPPSPAVAVASGGYPGVILWPEIRPVPLLIAPLPTGNGSFAGSTNPLSIPFGGEYWMYRWPFLQPPAQSYFARGSPVALTFSTTDHEPLQMEARQQLEQSIYIRCCGEIRLAIRNADAYWRGISLELILVDQLSPRTRLQYLGAAQVLSGPAAKDDPPRPVEETLRFPIPAAPTVERFDLLKVVFHGARRGKSARISIDRFVLVPPVGP